MADGTWKTSTKSKSNHNGGNTSQVPPRLLNGYSGNDPRRVLDREIRSLARHEANAKNIRWHFEEELKKSEDRLKRAFNEMRERLAQRESDLLAELSVCKTEGETLLDERELMFQELKALIARAASMNGRDIEDLRQKIKKFLQDRREDDLGKTLRFQYEPDKLIHSIGAFGEVQPVNGRAISAPNKSPSLVSLMSSADGGDASSAGSLDVRDKSVINEVNVGGLVIQSDSMNADQLAVLSRQLQESLRMQGITEDILPEVSGSLTGPMPQRRRPANNAVNGRPGSGNGGPQRGRRQGGSDKKKRGQ